MLLVSRDLPQLQVVDVGTDDLLVASATILWPDKFDECVVNVRTARMKKAASGTQLMEEVELMVLRRTTDTQRHPFTDSKLDVCINYQ